MDSKEFGLVAAQQLFKIEDIHYGFWEDGENATLGNWKEAQETHTEFLFTQLHIVYCNLSIGDLSKRQRIYVQRINKLIFDLSGEHGLFKNIKEQEDSETNYRAAKALIIQQRIVAGEGATESDFSDAFPFLPLTAAQLAAGETGVENSPFMRTPRTGGYT